MSGHFASSATLWRNLSALVGLWLLVFVAGCGETDTHDAGGPQAALSLVSPKAPIGLHYGEQVTLLWRYRLQGQPAAGVTLNLHIDSDNTGATLSADRVVTNDQGEASVLLTAGASEAAFHVLCTAPMADDLSIDAAVSKYAFGSLDLLVDATEVAGSIAVLRAALVEGSTCAALPPTPKLGPVLRAQQATERRAVLPFPTLLVQPYSAIGRVEDVRGRLLAYGCVDLPADLLRTGLHAMVPIPLSLVFPSPLGTYALSLKLDSKPQAPRLWAQMACTSGIGQSLLDAMLSLLPPADGDVMQLVAARASQGQDGCRSGTDNPDDRLQNLLVANSAGTGLGQVAKDAAALQAELQLASQLEIYAATNRDILGNHLLKTATLDTGLHSATYSLAKLPVPGSSNLLLHQDGNVLLLPAHALTLRLPALWRQALEELSLVPRGLDPPARLLRDAVEKAQSSAYIGCDAVAAVLCAGLPQSCSSTVKPACTPAKDALANKLTAEFADPPPDLDFSLAISMLMEDPDGTLQAQVLDAGQVTAQTTTFAMPLPFTGTANGIRQ